ncbi:MAG: hypothetical protein JXN61_17845 [Sedimentisphaerales bacterium]|nr:hypothetical protein [Sedimentisphaerales bacterium]
MNIDWKKKKAASVKWLGVGPAFLIYLIFIQDMKIFENGVAEGVFLSAVFIIMPAVAVLVVYWPMDATAKDLPEEEPHD